MHRLRPTARTGTALAVTGLLPAFAAVLSGTVSVTRCVAVPGELARLGVHLALLRPAAECPGLALGGESRQVLAIAVMLTLPMLLLHLGAVAAGWGGYAALRSSLARLSRLVPWRRVPAARTAVVPAPVLAVVRAAHAPVRSVPLRVPLLRGPPGLPA